MAIATEHFFIKTNGFTDIVDITKEVKNIIRKQNVSEGQALVYVAGSTASVTSIEYEPGLLKDLPEALEKIAPIHGKVYHHDEAWQDGNGYAHVRASIIGNSLSIPVLEYKPVLGAWQQVVLIDFDNKQRDRKITVQVIS